MRGTRIGVVALPVATILVAVVLTGTAAAASSDGSSTPIVRGPHVSGVARYQPGQAPSASAATPTCSYGSNYVTDCAGTTGRPVNETAIATGTSSGGGFVEVAGANDYNSYNGQGQDGFYTSPDGKSWADTGPIDVFPHNPNNAAGDPGVAIGAGGTVYYSSLFFNFHSCNVGGVELLVGSPNPAGSGGAAGYTWSTYQIASNSHTSFQDKPAIAYDATGSRVYESWTQFGSCTGVNVTSPIQVAVFNAGTTAGAPAATFQVGGSTYSQGSALAPDGSGGFWIAWEEFPTASATIGEIKLAHYTYSGGVWVESTPAVVSPPDFADLQSPLPGFSFRDNSFPALTVVAGVPYVVWAADTLSTVTSGGGHHPRTVVQGPGLTYLSVNSGFGTAVTAAPTTGDQFFPAVTTDGSAVDVSFCQTDTANSSYDAYLVTDLSSSTSLPVAPSKVTQVSTGSSYPNQDAFFSGQFIGDYNALAHSSLGDQPIWTDIRQPDPNYPGYEMDAVVNTP